MEFFPLSLPWAYLLIPTGREICIACTYAKRHPMSPPSTELIHSKINSEPKKNKNKKERPDATIFGWRKCGAASPRTFPTQRCTQVRIPDYPSKTVSIDGVTSSHTYIWRISSSILIRDLKVRMAQTSPIWNVRLLDGLKRWYAGVIQVAPVDPQSVRMTQG